MGSVDSLGKLLASRREFAFRTGFESWNEVLAG